MRYQLDWVQDGVARSADGAGWEVTNDLGYRVHLTRGYLTSYSMELVECPKAASPTPLAAIERLPWPAIIGIAWAGHLSGTPNPAAIHPMQVESLTAPAARAVGSVLLQPQPYCQLHYLVARAGHDSPGLPSDLDMVDATLHVEGTYRAPGSPTAAPFMLHTPAANGGLFDHTASGAALHVDTGRAAVRVTVRRHLGKIFDGVDFTKMSTRMVAGQILKSLIDHVEVTVEQVDAGA